MYRLSDATTRVVSKNFSRKFVSIGRIVKAWPEIMGKQFAEKAAPVRLLYRKARRKKDRPIVTLEIGVSQSDAMMLHYQKDIILERITTVFGEAWIADIKFVSMDLKKAPSKVKKHARPLTTEQKNHLSDLLEKVDDQAIYERLSSLGEGVLKGKS